MAFGLCLKIILNILAILYIINTLFIYKDDIQRERLKMSRARIRSRIVENEQINPFAVNDNTEALMKSLASIDSRDLMCKFKNTQDPINLAFETIESTSLKTLAKDFVKESFYDFFEFIKDACK